MSDAMPPAVKTDAAATQPDPATLEASPFAGLSNNELAVIRTDFASDRTELARDRNRMAADRTLLAWIRTSLSMISFGFGIDRFFAYLQRTETNFLANPLNEERILGLSLISLGVFALLAAVAVHWSTLKNLEQPKFKPVSGWSLSMTVAIILAFVGLASFIPLLTQNVDLAEIFNLDSPVIQNIISLCLFLIMLTVGLSLPWSELLRFWQQPSLLLRSLLAVVVLPPIFITLTLYVFRQPTDIMIALGLLAAAPGPPLLTKRAAMAGADFNYVASLQITVALLSIVVTPLVLEFAQFLFPLSPINADSLQIAKQVALVQFLPLSLGLGIRTFWPKLNNGINSFLKTVANTLFLVIVLLALVLAPKLIISLNLIPLLLGVLLSLLGLAIGHLIGNVDEPGIQSGLAVTVIARNVGLAIFIATINGQTAAVSAIVGFLLVGIVVGLPYSIWMKRRIAQSEMVSTPPSAPAT